MLTRKPPNLVIKLMSLGFLLQFLLDQAKRYWKNPNFAKENCLHLMLLFMVVNHMFKLPRAMSITLSKSKTTF